MILHEKRWPNKGDGERAKKQQHPEIIDRPELRSPVRTGVESLITVLFWAGYVYCLLPVVQGTMMIMGVGFHGELAFGGSSRALITLIYFVSKVMLLVGFSFGLWCLYNYVKYRGGREKARLPEPLAEPCEPEEAPRRILLPRWRMTGAAFMLFSICLVLWIPPCGERLAGMGGSAVEEAPGTGLADARPLASYLEGGETGGYAVGAGSRYVWRLPARAPHGGDGKEHPGEGRGPHPDRAEDSLPARGGGGEHPAEISRGDARPQAHLEGKASPATR